jgi:enterochelin esterase-like enzyme
LSDKYKAFKRIDGNWSIIDQEEGQTLDLVIPSEELAKQVSTALEEAYFSGYSTGHGHGYSNGTGLW